MEGEFSGEHEQQSILERIKNAKETLGVSPRQLADEFDRLFGQGDEQAKKGVSELFDAYLSWELRGSPKDQTPDDIRSRSLRNFDRIAEIADTRRAWEDDISVLTLVSGRTPPQPIGKVRQFYRDAVDYHPPTPPSPSNN